MDLTQNMVDLQFVLFKYGSDGIYSLSTHYIADNSPYISLHIALSLLYQGLQWNSFRADSDNEDAGITFEGTLTFEYFYSNSSQ